MSVTALLDGDVMIYESASAAEKRMDFDGESVTHVDMPAALANFDARVETIRKHTGADRVIVALSDPTRRYWRHDIYPNYKASRGVSTPPIARKAVREHSERAYSVIHRPGLEADDILGILATDPAAFPGDKIIVTTDKDLRQIPGLHLNPAKLANGVFTVDEAAGDRWHMCQTLTGDAVDGYPGCPGVGRVRAEKILNDAEPGRVWDAVVAAYVRRGKSPDDALRQAQVARILRSSEWDYTLRAPILWRPQENKN